MTEVVIEPGRDAAGTLSEPLTRAQARRARLVRRPNGRRMMAIGWVVFGIGVAMGYLAANANDLYDVVFFGSVAVFGAVLVIFGHLTRAIFFLPGRIVTRGDL